MKYIIAILVVSIIIQGCEPVATFDKPQPDGVSPLTSFPSHLQGKYLAADESSILIIENNRITRHYSFDNKQLKDSLGSSYKIEGDTMINVKDGIKEKIALVGDTIIQHINGIDTLFSLSDAHVAKKYKGYYFLNTRYDEHRWEVKELSLKKGVLTVGEISSKEDIQKLKEITETTADTSSEHFMPTKRQFKNFVKQNGFSAKEVFYRVIK